ncbi:histidine N-alpha-methyltransferase-like [Argopecten irradians]|uniref:histidine N-alpha-methyltransferase-like n=1 Tax=Argopecten irradians TaxID=31199 RepID=UPI003713200B
MADELKQTLVAGLESSPKYIPFSYEYDEVGSRLQKDNNDFNDGYYLTASETWILQHNVQDIIPDAPNDLTLVDLCSGDCSKTRFVIDDLIKRQSTLTFYPLDISGEFLLKAATKLKNEYGDSLKIHPIVSDYKEGIEQLRQIKGTKLILWIGTIFNLSYEDQISTLRLISTIMTDQCRLAFSADITLSRDAVLKAYNDDGAGLGIDLAMKKGEHLYLHEGVGLSCKYTLEQLQTIVEKAGLRLAGTLIDNKKHAVFCQCVTK